MENADLSMARLCNRLMSAEQQALDTLAYSLDEMNYLAEQNPAREDIRACIEEIKTKIKADESRHWTIANHWAEHFDGIAPHEEGEKAEGAKEPQGQAEDE